MWPSMTRSLLSKEPLPFPAISLCKIRMIGPLLSPTTFSGPSVEGHWNFVLLPPYTLHPSNQTQTPCFYPSSHPHTHTHTVSSSLHFFKDWAPFPGLLLLSPASALTHSKQFYCLSPNLAHCLHSSGLLPPRSHLLLARAMWCLNHGYQDSFTFTVPKSLCTALFLFCSSNWYPRHSIIPLTLKAKKAANLWFMTYIQSCIYFLCLFTF